MTKTIEIFAGPNGSGKTTFSELILRGRKNIKFFNSDKLAVGMIPVANEAVQFEAGRIMLQQIESAFSKGESFSFETTFSGKLWKSYLSKAKKDGYKIIIYFVFVQNIDLSLTRIKQRVKIGGHNVPSKIVRRRFLRTFENMQKLYMPFADEWYVVDNSNHKPIIIAQSSKKGIEIFNSKTFNKFFK
jgi:predicted ABC-type ATPase